MAHWYGFMLRHELGRYEEALELHRRGIELDPLSGPLMTNIAADLLALGRYDEARQWPEKAIDVLPDYPSGWKTLGIYRWTPLGPLDDVLAAYARALALDPNNATYLTDTGNRRLDIGDPIGAEHLIARSLALGPESVDPNIAMHLLKLYQGDEAGALEYARRANAIQSRVNIGTRAIGVLRDHELRADRISAAMALSGSSAVVVVEPACSRRLSSTRHREYQRDSVDSRVGLRSGSDAVISRSNID